MSTPTEFNTSFTNFCLVIAATPGKTKAALLAATAATVFAEYDPQNWCEVQRKTIPAFKELPGSRLSMAPEPFDEGVCCGLYTAWLAVRDSAIDPF